MRFPLLDLVRRNDEEEEDTEEENYIDVLPDSSIIVKQDDPDSGEALREDYRLRIGIYFYTTASSYRLYVVFERVVFEREARSVRARPRIFKYLKILKDQYSNTNTRTQVPSLTLTNPHDCLQIELFLDENDTTVSIENNVNFNVEACTNPHSYHASYPNSFPPMCGHFCVSSTRSRRETREAFVLRCTNT